MSESTRDARSGAESDIAIPVTGVGIDVVLVHGFFSHLEIEIS